MNTFYSIIQRTIKSNRIFFPKFEEYPGSAFYKNVYEYERQNIDMYPFLTLTCYDAIYYAHMTCGKQVHNVKKRTKVKYEILDGVLNNIFFTNSQKDDFFTVFSKVQKTYTAIARFARLVKIRLAKVQITEDLYMNPIEESDKNVMRIYQRGSNYLFTARDLANIINKSLMNNQDYFCDPLPIKNPYTNVTFSYAIMYNIYFFIRQSTMIMPQLLHLYFINNFNLTNFAIDNECALRDICIHNYVFNTPFDYLHDKILYMILSNTYTQKWIICKEFDKDVLAKIMLPYFYLNEISYYSLNPDKKYKASRELSVKLKSFYYFNQLFGRKIITPRSNGVPVINKLCPDFYKAIAPELPEHQSYDILASDDSDEEQTVIINNSSVLEEGEEEEED